MSDIPEYVNIIALVAILAVIAVIVVIVGISEYSLYKERVELDAKLKRVKRSLKELSDQMRSGLSGDKQ